MLDTQKIPIPPPPTPLKELLAPGVVDMIKPFLLCLKLFRIWVLLFLRLRTSAGPLKSEPWEEVSGALREDGQWEEGWGGLAGVGMDTGCSSCAESGSQFCLFPEIWGPGDFLTLGLARLGTVESLSSLVAP